MGEQNITVPETPDLKDEKMIVDAPAVSVTIPAAQVAQAIEGRLTTGETETVQAGKTVADRLLTVKSLVTLSMTVCFIYLSIAGQIDAEKFMTIFTTITAFYFGVQTVKDKA